MDKVQTPVIPSVMQYRQKSWDNTASAKKVRSPKKHFLTRKLCWTFFSDYRCQNGEADSKILIYSDRTKWNGQALCSFGRPWETYCRLSLCKPGVNNFLKMFYENCWLGSLQVDFFPSRSHYILEVNLAIVNLYGWFHRSLVWNIPAPFYSSQRWKLCTFHFRRHGTRKGKPVYRAGNPKSSVHLHHSTCYTSVA
jgi:hypothetical protein